MNWWDFLGSSAVGALVTQAGLYLRARWKNKTDITKNAQDMAEIHNYLFPFLLDNTECNWIVIFRGTNSAGKIAPGKILKVSGVYEDTRSVPRIIDDIQDWRADAHYYQLFSEMMTNGFVKIRTADLPEESKLKTIYTQQGVTYSEIYHLTTTKADDKVFYCTIASTTVEKFSNKERYHVDIVISRLRNIFDKQKNVL